MYSVSALSVYIQRTLGFRLSSSFSVFFIVILWFVPLDASIQFYASSAIGGSSLGFELWRTRGLAQLLAYDVPAVSWPPDSCHLAWILAVFACGLAHSSYTSSPLG